MRAPKPYRWGFLSASLVIFLLVAVGQAVGFLAETFRASGTLSLRDYLLLGFLVSTLGYVLTQRSAVLRFFRTMHVGVSLVSACTVAIMVGVLVPQIDGFEDPEQRVTAENYEEQYKAFAWAEGYFLYHLKNLYGIGMPSAELPPQALAGLERYKRAYGIEEGENREKEMRAMFGGRGKTDEIGYLIYENDELFRSAFDVCTALHLNRTYKSHWFLMLVSLLGTAIACNTFRGPARTWIQWRRLGFFVTHMGMMTMLIGGGISKWKTDRGILHLELDNPPENIYWGYFNRHKPREMPFHVGLERFARHDWKTLEVRFTDRNFTSRPPTYTLWPGRTIDLDYAENAAGELAPRLRLVVKELHERAVLDDLELREATTEDDPDRTVGRIVDFTVPDWEGLRAAGLESPAEPGGERHTASILRKPDWPGAELWFDPLWEFRVLTSAAGERSAARELFPEAGDSFLRLGYRVEDIGEAEVRYVDVRVGEEVSLTGGYRLTIGEAIPNFRVVYQEGRPVPIQDTRSMELQFPRNPALWVSIQGPTGGEPERRLVLQNLDAKASEMQQQYPFDELELDLTWDPWNAPGPLRHVLMWDNKESAVLLGEGGGEQPAVPGENLPLSGRSFVKLEGLYLNALMEPKLEFLPRTESADGFDADFYAREPSGLVLEAISFPGTDQEVRQTYRMATSDAGLANTKRGPAGRTLLRFFENTRAFPFEWRSVLQIYKRDANGRLAVVDRGPERAREIRVNDYFMHRGFRFFQTNAIPELPNYSGIGVVYDPGIPFVLLGMYIIIAGTAIAFILRPIMLGRQERAKGRAQKRSRERAA